MSLGQDSLQQRLLRQFLWVGLLPLLAATTVAVLLLVPALLAQGEARNLELATAVRDQVQQQLASRQRAALLVAGEIGAGRVAQAAVPDTLRALVDHDSLLLAAYLTDSLGVVEQVALPQGSGLNAVDMIGLDQSAQPHFGAARRSGQPVWSQTYLSLLTGRITAVLVVPAGSHMLMVELALDSLSHSLADIGRAADTRPIVIDHAGRVIGHPDASLALQQENLRNLDPVRRAIDGNPGSARLTVGGVDYLTQALPVLPVGWTILVMQPTRAVLGPLIGLGVLLGSALLLTVLAAVWVSWLLARRSGREVARLADGTAAALRTGEQAPALEFEIAEFRAVWARLRTLFAELHQRDRQTDSARRDLQAVLDAATEVAIIATDTRGIVTVFSIGAQKMLLLNAATVVGQHTPALWHDADEVRRRSDELSRQFGQHIHGFEVFVHLARHAGYEVRDWVFIRSDGVRLDVSLAVTAMRNAEGDITGFLGVAIDVSQRRRSAELDVARRIAEAASQAKTEFLSRMSHELRTPLNAVLGYAQLMELSADEPPTAAQHKHLVQIQRSGWHLVQLIDDVLDLARIESGQLRVSLEPVDPVQAVARALEIAEPQMRKLGIHFSLAWLDGHDGRHLVPVMADMTRLTQVLVNLLSNAAKYNRPGGSVRLECEALPQQRSLAFRVIDTGLGMDEEQLAQLYQPFNRLGREADAIEGTGIGLVITRRLLEQMHGSISVSSTAGEGSVFTVLLPQQPRGPVELATEPAPLPLLHQPGPRGLVLYIEDNAVNAKLMREIMRQRPAIELVEAGTASEGLALARQRRPDLVLLDMHLPDADGFAVLKQLADEPACAGIPVVAISADATRSQMASALDRGVRAYLTKPIKVVEVLQAVDGALGG
ncbi:ATP-binding protein [Sphaerotilaceae bacterium SBD11-9]